jgi:hypothetical protein
LQQTNARDLIVGSEFIAVRSQLNARTLASHLITLDVMNASRYYWP